MQLNCVSIFSGKDQTVDFSKAVFSDVADFSWAVFNGTALFNNTIFSKGANFGSTYFWGAANFSECTFMGIFDFTGVSFYSSVVFKKSRFYGVVDFVYQEFPNGCDLTQIEIKGKLRFEKVNFESVSFINTDLRKMDFINCTWPEKDGRQVLYDELSAYSKQGWPDFKDNIKKVELLYRQLKQKYKEEHNEYELSNWHYGEKEMQRKRSSWKNFSFYLLNLYWVSSGYGEDPVRAVVVLFFLIVYSSWLLAIAGITVPYDSINGIAKSIYGIKNIIWPYDFDFEKVWALLLNTLKYVTFQKDYFFEPINWFGETVKILAQVLIPLQTALFALAVRNRFRR